VQRSAHVSPTCCIDKQVCILFDEQPVPRRLHCGEGFHYRVGYRPKDDHGQMSIREVRDASSSELIVYDVPLFQQYEIFVQSVNNHGEAPILGGERKMGYSGEGRMRALLSTAVGS